ncbi:MAG: DUF2470 domain-containing protein [Alphaproteobacteria bacterium]|nr:DUF2470 domain-containing protein [Alphaproteobacteria bacterium]
MTDDESRNAAGDAGAVARGLVRGAATVSLGTLLPLDAAKAGAGKSAGWPFASLVLVATDHDGAPLLLLSSLAEHTRALAEDSRCTLLFDGTFGQEDPLTGARLSLLGRAERSTDPVHKARFLSRHRSARQYVDFGDFSMFVVRAERAHLVAGFGQIAWLEQTALAPGGAVGARRADGDLREAEPRIVAHMNADHADALDSCAARLLGLAGEGWEMIGIDPEGFDLWRAGQIARLAFESPVFDAADARGALVDLANKARNQPT